MYGNNTEIMEQQVVIVSRDVQFRDALRRVCAGQDFRVDTTEFVTNALEIAVRSPVCVMVADVSIQEPGDGERLVNSVHEQNPDAKCFLIVDEEAAAVVSSAENEAWLRLIHKPIAMLQFAADVVDAIAKSTAGD